MAAVGVVTVSLRRSIVPLCFSLMCKLLKLDPHSKERQRRTNSPLTLLTMSYTMCSVMDVDPVNQSVAKHNALQIVADILQ